MMISLLLLLFAIFTATAADESQVISGWLSLQTNVQTWAADFTQTRTLQSLTQPLVSTGEVWFAAPRNFRWELGGNRTIAIRSNDTMLVEYPRLKRAELYNFSSAGPSEWKDAIGLLESGFPRSKAEIERQFNITSISRTSDLYELALEPKSAGARKLMPRITVLIATNYSLAGTELVFADGSRMRNDFRNIRTNISVEGKFDLAIPPGFKRVEPLKSGRE